MITITDTNITVAIITIISIAIITISPKCVHICPHLVGSDQQIPLENLSWRSALPKIQLSTCPAECQAAIVTTITLKHCGIMSRWLRSKYGSDYDIDQRHDFGSRHPLPGTRHPAPGTHHQPPGTRHLSSATHYPPPLTRHLTPTTRHPTPTTCLPVLGACNSGSLWIVHPGAYMGAYSQVRLGVSCLWRVYLGVYLGVCLRAS